MFSLRKLAYYVCDEEERTFYDDLETIKIDIQHCCSDLLTFLQNLTNSNNMDDNIDLNYGEYSMIEKASASVHLECLTFAESRGFP
ncbi:unnamed protein product [Macrosiphum euphorbiae]|nr:unnamed protein product [Macrosiphum euphorbiae]